MSTQPTHKQETFRDPGQDNDLGQMVMPHTLARRLLVDLYKDILSQPELFPGSTNEFLYKQDGGDLVISANNVEEHLPKNPKRAVIVTRGPIIPAKNSINNFRGLRTSSIQADFTIQLQSQVTVTVYGQKSRDSEDLAMVLSLITLTFRDEIRKRSNLHTLGEPTIDAPQPTEFQDSQVMKYQTSFTMLAVYDFSWVVVEDLTKAWKVKLRLQGFDNC